MVWRVVFHEDFEAEFVGMTSSVRERLLAATIVLAQFGPSLGRPTVDTLKGSAHANMKELRFKAADGVWRVAFAFDPRQDAILLCAGDKSGIGSDRFYRSLIRRADDRYARYIASGGGRR